jgi:hypothetical protein
MGHKKFKKQKKKTISKGLLESMSNFNLLKVHNYHLVKISQNKIPHLPL